jgi:hypothetical protein
MQFDDEILEKLILDGIVEFAGLDKNGDMLYSFSEDLAERAPEIFNTVVELHMLDMYHLWESGFLAMDITESNPMIRLTAKAFDEDSLNNLPNQMQLMLEQIKDAMRIDGGE